MGGEVHISEAARRLGISASLLRQLEREEKNPSERRDFNGRLYSEDDLAPRQGTGGGGVIAMSRCSFIRADGARCERTASDGYEYCYSHNPSRAEERSRNAKKAGKTGGKGRGKPVEQELIDLKHQLQNIADGVLGGAVLQGQATAAVQALNCLARILELQRRWRELGEVEERLDALEQRLERRRGAS